MAKRKAPTKKKETFASPKRKHSKEYIEIKKAIKRLRKLFL